MFAAISLDVTISVGDIMNEMGDLIDELRKIVDGDEEPIYIIVKVPVAFALDLPDLTESQWKQKGNYCYRIDPPDPSRKGQQHIHVANKRHLAAKSKQVSWNVDGSRHDASNFNSSMSGIEKAKNIARDVLNLGQDIILEKTTVHQTIIESMTHCPDETTCVALALMMENCEHGGAGRRP